MTFILVWIICFHLWRILRHHCICLLLLLYYYYLLDTSTSFTRSILSLIPTSSITFWTYSLIFIASFTWNYSSSLFQRPCTIAFPTNWIEFYVECLWSILIRIDLGLIWLVILIRWIRIKALVLIISLVWMISLILSLIWIRILVGRPLCL